MRQTKKHGMATYRRWAVVAVAGLLVALTGCSRVQRGESLIQLPDCDAGVTWQASGSVSGGHALPMHSGSASAGFTADCDGGPGPGYAGAPKSTGEGLGPVLSPPPVVPVIWEFDGKEWVVWKQEPGVFLTE